MHEQGVAFQEGGNVSASGLGEEEEGERWARLRICSRFNEASWLPEGKERRRCDPQAQQHETTASQQRYQPYMQLLRANADTVTTPKYYNIREGGAVLLTGKKKRIPCSTPEMN